MNQEFVSSIKGKMNYNFNYHYSSYFFDNYYIRELKVYKYLTIDINIKYIVDNNQAQ